MELLEVRNKVYKNNKSNKEYHGNSKISVTLTKENIACKGKMRSIQLNVYPKKLEEN